MDEGQRRHRWFSCCLQPSSAAPSIRDAGATPPPPRAFHAHCSRCRPPPPYPRPTHAHAADLAGLLPLQHDAPVPGLEVRPQLPSCLFHPGLADRLPMVHSPLQPRLCDTWARAHGVGVLLEGSGLRRGASQCCALSITALATSLIHVPAKYEFLRNREAFVFASKTGKNLRLNFATVQFAQVLEGTAYILGGTHVSCFGHFSQNDCKSEHCCHTQKCRWDAEQRTTRRRTRTDLAARTLQTSESCNHLITPNFCENLPNFTAPGTIINVNFGTVGPERYILAKCSDLPNTPVLRPDVR